MVDFSMWSGWLVLLVSVGIGCLAPLLMGWMIYRSPIKGVFVGGVGIEPALIGSASLLFGLFAAFLANDIWSRNQVARTAVNQEADSLRTLARYAEGLGAENYEPLRLALSDYAQTVIEKDWPMMEQGGRSKELLGKVRVISNLLVTGNVGKAAGPTIQGKMIDAFTGIRENRQIRVQMAESRKLTIKWYSMVAFGVITQLAIALVHINRPRAHLFAQIVFGIGLSVSLFIFATNEFPFSPLNPVSAEPLVKAVESLYRN